MPLDQTGDSVSRVPIRAARHDELTLLIEIERAAGERFRSLGMDLVADDHPGSVAELLPYTESGRAFVSVDANDRPVAYLLLDAVDRAAHVEQVSVHPATLVRESVGRSSKGRRHGRAATGSTRSPSRPTSKSRGTGLTTSGSGSPISPPTRKHRGSAPSVSRNARLASMLGRGPACAWTSDPLRERRRLPQCGDCHLTAYV